MLTFVAVPWFVLQTTGSAALTGLAGGAVALAAVLASLFGGPAVDRLGFKETSVVSDLASGLTVAAIPALYLTVGLEFWQLLGLLFAGSLLDTPGMTARQGMIPGPLQEGRDAGREAQLGPPGDPARLLPRRAAARRHPHRHGGI